MKLRTGLAAQADLVVGEQDTAISLGSGDVPVLGTPRVVALAESATVAAVAPALPPGRTTVGTRVEVQHRAPTPLGRQVTAAAVLVGVDGRKLVFDVTVRDEEIVVATAVVERVVVDRERFLGGAR
jgi:fluoroacetyl-CoA thioesterase